MIALARSDHCESREDIFSKVGVSSHLPTLLIYGGTLNKRTDATDSRSRKLRTWLAHEQLTERRRERERGRIPGQKVASACNPQVTFQDCFKTWQRPRRKCMSRLMRASTCRERKCVSERERESVCAHTVRKQYSFARPPTQCLRFIFHNLFK